MKILHVTTSYPLTTFFTGPPQQIHTLAQELVGAALDEALSESAPGSIERWLRGRRWMTDEFSWPTVARRMAEFYLSVVDCQPRGTR